MLSDHQLLSFAQKTIAAQDFFRSVVCVVFEMLSGDQLLSSKSVMYRFQEGSWHCN